jgi:uncharacterized GH25 family protein
MRFALRSILARGACALLVAGSCAHAAAVRLQPDRAAPAPGEPVVVRIVAGASAEDAGTPVDAVGADLMQRIWKYGRADLAPAGRDANSIRFRPERPGVNLVVYRSDRNGAYAKTIVIAGAVPEGDPLRWSEVGQRLEIVPQTDPVSLADSGGTLEVQVLFEREPLAGARIEAAPVDGASGGATSAVTDEIGLARVPIGGPGWWVVRVAHRSDTSPRELTATLTMHAGAPSR